MGEKNGGKAHRKNEIAETEPLDPTMPPTPGGPKTLPETIGRYRVCRLIASGGMGVVYEAIQANPRRTVAKVRKE